MAGKVLVTLGGSDPDKVTLKVIKALRHVELHKGEAVVVVGGGNPHLAELEAAARCAKGVVHLRTNVTDMSELMAWADMAVSGGGTTSWERALLKLPTIVLVLADNQREVAAACAASGLCWNLGRAGAVTEADIANALGSLLRDRTAREEMAQRGAADWSMEREQIVFRCTCQEQACASVRAGPRRPRSCGSGSMTRWLDNRPSTLDPYL